MKLAFSVDGGAASRAAIGAIVLQSDETLEPEFRTVFDLKDVALYHSRIPNATTVTPETLKQMEREIPRAASLLPTSGSLDVVGFGCTSGATVIGSDKVAAAIRSVHPDAKTTDPIAAVIAACSSLAITRLGFVTPYVAEVSAAMRRLLENHGLTIAAFGSFEQIEDEVVARISPRSVRDAIRKIGGAEDVEAVFVSCTNLRSFDIIDDVESEIGKPVITSNQAFAWHLLKLAGLETESRGPGRLFENR